MTRIGPLIFLVWALAHLNAHAFVVHGPEDAVDAIDNLERAPRWAVTGTAHIAGGDRGLGGGLEYAIDPSLCEIRFSDGSTCEDVHLTIQQAFAMWGSGHPSLWFTNVTGHITPDGRTPNGRQHWGAEIDILAADREEFSVFQDASITGYTVFYEQQASLIKLTNGETTKRPIGRIESADLRINRELCYYIKIREARRDCIHFPSVILHEISHILGISHPDEAPHLNLDSDDLAGNEIAIGCMNPTATLKQTSDVDGAAVAHGQDVQDHGRFFRGLTWDDVAARNALYPDCGVKWLPRFSRQWGAFAIGEDGSSGQARLFRKEEEAGVAALSKCQQDGAICQLMQTFDNCFALAVSANGALGWATSARTDMARNEALQACAAEGGACSLKADFCAFEIERR